MGNTCHVRETGQGFLPLVHVDWVSPFVRGVLCIVGSLAVTG
jgi:hypothetical protein